MTAIFEESSCLKFGPLCVLEGVLFLKDVKCCGMVGKEEKKYRQSGNLSKQIEAQRPRKALLSLSLGL